MGICGATKGGLVDYRGPNPIVAGGYACTRRPHHTGQHHDGKKGHTWGGVPPCPCACNDSPPGFCGGCGHAGCTGGINVR